MSDENLAAVRANYAAWNAHDQEAWVKTFSEDSVYESENFPTSPVRGHAGMRDLFKLFTSAFPDTHIETLQEIASGPHVVTRVTAKGTQGGEFIGIPATHRPVAFEICFVSEIRNGLIVHSWAYWDGVTMLRQPGMMPEQI